MKLSTARESRPRFLTPETKQMLLFGGKGGVGKTTCAVATALYLARSEPDDAFLLVSTDPAHSLYDSLAGASLPSNLRVREIDAADAVRRFKDAYGDYLREIALRGTFLDPDDVTRLLDLSLPGFDEVMAFHEIAMLLERDIDTHIIVDTAPTGHTLRLLSMPAFLRSWLGLLDAMLAKHRYLSELYSGEERRDEVDDFVDMLSQMLDRVNALLSDYRRCQFVPIMLAERLSINETTRLLQRLRQWRIPVADLVVNRLCPPNTACSRCWDLHDRQNRVLEASLAGMVRCTFWGIPDQGVEVRGGSALTAFWDHLRPLREFAHQTPSAPAVAPCVADPATLPPPQARILIFGGKGGVGKTTLAAATALRLSQERPDARILLFSTDPAHSLSDCFGQTIGREQTPIAPGLSALEIDAQAEFTALRDHYVAEVNNLLNPVSDVGQLSFRYDHEVMQRVLDLAPPGLDEVMAITRALELLESGTYETLILDAAPTGHLLRLLELPQQLQDWLKVVFSLFLKYRVASRLSRLSEFLVTLSRRLKRLQAILADPNQGRLYVVTILTEMGFENTCDLIAACQRLNIVVPHIFLNMVTPESDCELCKAHHEAEEAVRKHLDSFIPDYPRSTVYQCSELRGTPALARLGELLYAAPSSSTEIDHHAGHRL